MNLQICFGIVKPEIRIIEVRRGLVVRVAENADFEFVKNSWTACFEDTPQFVDWNFEYNYSAENTVIAEKDGIPASAMQLMPYRLKLCGKVIDARYVSGVCTLPEYRGGGLVREMFGFALPKMYDMGADISILIPAVDGMYEKFGYRRIAERRLYEVEDICGFDTAEEISNNLILMLDRVYKKEMSQKSVYVDRCRFDWERILTDLLKLSGGKVLISDGGYALAYPKGEKFEIWEICGDIKLDAKIISAPPVMARIINVKKLNTGEAFCVKDKFIPQNNICINGCGREIETGELCERIFGSIGDGYINMLL